MKILIDDGMQIKVGTGIGKYSMYLYEELKKKIGSNGIVDLTQYDKGASSKKQGRLKYLIHINSGKFKKSCSQYDIVHFTNYAIPFRRNKNAKYVVTVHDLASFLHPESLPTIYKYYSRFIVNYSIKHADVVLTDSESAKKEIMEKFPKHTSKVNLAYPGLYFEYNSDQNNEQKSYESEVLSKIQKKKFFLFVGTVETRKNLGIVIKAFIELKKSGQDMGYRLVLAGRPGFGFDEYKKIIDESECDDDIITTGYISTNDVKKLYQEAAAYVFPTVYEGFGSTQLECMANQLPLILSDIPTNREVSNGYGLFFKLDNIEELKKRMLDVINNNYDIKNMKKIADKKLDEFSWSNLVEQFISIYNGVIK